VCVCVDGIFFEKTHIKFYNSLNHVILDNISILSLENDGIIKPNIFEFNEFKKLGEGIEGE